MSLIFFFRTTSLLCDSRVSWICPELGTYVAHPAPHMDTL